MTKSIEKGKVGERELCKKLHDHGYAARRAEQYQGNVPDGAPDIITDLDQLVYFEVKRRDAKFHHKAVGGWYEQVQKESPDDLDGVLAFRKDYQPFWAFFIPQELDAERPYVVLFGTDAFLDWYDSDNERALLDDPEHRHDVTLSRWAVASN